MSLANNSSPSSTEPYTDSNSPRYTAGRAVGRTCFTSMAGGKRLSRIFRVLCKSEMDGSLNKKSTLAHQVSKSGSLGGRGLLPEKTHRRIEVCCDSVASLVFTMCSTTILWTLGGSKIFVRKTGQVVAVISSVVVSGEGGDTHLVLYLVGFLGSELLSLLN